MEGKIIRAVAGFYYVDVDGLGIITCKPRGVFRNQNISPLIGDMVEISISEENEKEGQIISLATRKNSLIRPAVANVDQIILVFTLKKPKISQLLLDRFLVAAEMRKIEPVICLNKADLSNEEDLRACLGSYKKIGYKTLAISAYNKVNIDRFKELLRGKTSVLAGPSGVGKSSIINILQEDHVMEVGEISKKTKRGRHTTRQTSIIPLDKKTYIIDTPGFTSLDIDNKDEDSIKYYFIEFKEYSKNCRYAGCNHIKELDCGVKFALEEGKISSQRYKSYLAIYKEIKEKKAY